MQRISGKSFKKILESGVNKMINNRERIDAMNVFPVPDGDTGSNMASSVEYAWNEVKPINSESISELMTKFARGMLLGARGNSGVILSQFFKGFSVGMSDKKQLSAVGFVYAFKSAKEYAYNSVMKPIEGTMLTVIRMIAEEMEKVITVKTTVEEAFEIASKTAKKACLDTPNHLPVLKEVGVTDSGGEGILMIIEGMLEALNSKPVKISEQARVDVSQTFISQEQHDSGEFGYCTEFIVELKSVKSFRKDRFQLALEKMGNSIVAVQDAEILKIHIHAEKPGAVISFAQKFGEFAKLKIENMTLQANESYKVKNKIKNTTTSSEPIKIGVISCNTGSGIIKEMEQLGASFIIGAGQTENPSAKDFMEAIESLDTDQIIILPNNSNIILAAQQVVQTTKKEVVVIPTKTQMEGIVAMLNFDGDGKFSVVREAMEDSLDDVKTGQITIAGKTTKIKGVSVKEGEYLSIAEREIIGSKKSKKQAAIEICKKLIDEDTELVTIFYGEDASEIDAEDIASYIETNYEADVEIKEGGQQVYNFLMAFE